MIHSVRSTAIVVIIAIISASAALYAWRNDALNEVHAETTRALFRADFIPVDNVMQIELSRRGEETLSFHRNGVRWTQIDPFSYPMSSFSMRQFARAAADTVVVGEVESDEATAIELGLEPPIATLTLKWNGGSTTLRFGRKALGGRAYLQRDDDARVIVTDQVLYERAVEQHPNEWRERHIFEFAGPDSDRIVIESQDRWVLDREGRRWSISEPVVTRVDSRAMDEFLAALSDLQSSAFVLDLPAELGTFGLDTPVAEVSVLTPTAATNRERSTAIVTERLLIGSQRLRSQDNYVMLEGRPVIVTVAQASLQRLLAPSLLIDPTPCAVDPSDVRSIRISEEDEFTIERDPADPSIWRSEGRVVSSEVVSRLLTALTQTRATRYQVSALPLEHLVASILLTGFDGRPLNAGNLRIARDPQSGYWAFDNYDGLLRLCEPTVEIPLSRDDLGLSRE